MLHPALTIRVYCMPCTLWLPPCAAHLASCTGPLANKQRVRSLTNRRTLPSATAASACTTSLALAPAPNYLLPPFRHTSFRDSHKCLLACTSGQTGRWVDER
ncbi:hypothetical protein E2C01_081662 [Portunus trituberculatus]|uniref:Uncharacterized protein n=1 Tax=Portunus trituberculatus TaxID=210409 RepID=A0A5B7IYQ7_PORTR|nr:hypothetical protein [Portunus trituberculatus]